MHFLVSPLFTLLSKQMK